MVVRAQEHSNLRESWIQFNVDTIALDTLSVVPDSWTMTTSDGVSVDTSLYEFDWAHSRILLRDKAKLDSVKIQYRVFPFLFTAETRHKERSLLAPNMVGGVNPFEAFYTPRSSTEMFTFSSLEKSGSISRGIQVGNNQDLGVSSSLNLQLSGRLTPKLGVRAAISDNNIPVQPQGNTQNLQEFDQVYVQVYTDRTELTAGDFRMERPDGYFMSFKKRAQGLGITHKFPLRSKKRPELEAGELKLTARGALSRGKFARQKIQGGEGNQGPYRLRGAENELFIIVLAGTERVFMDGKLMTRGQEHDYVIDYNTGEVTFTAKQLITKDKRIVVEFQYSDRNYTRSLVHAGAEYDHRKLKVRFNFYTEQDAKNQPVNIDLTEGRKLLLASIGDSLNQALIPSIDTVEFNIDEVLYKSIDTTVTVLGQPLIFNDILVYSTSPDSAILRVSFSDVGPGNGDYEQIPSGANGRVFQWVAPSSITGASQGQYMPIIQMVTPKQNQLYTLGAEYEISENSKIRVEGAISNTDLNLFSDIHNGDNVGLAAKVAYDQVIPLDTANKWSIVTGLDFEHTNLNFKPIERFRTVEFERDWSIANANANVDQYISMAYLGFNRKEVASLRYEARSFINAKTFNAWQHSLVGNVDYKGFNADVNGSFIESRGVNQNNQFGRYLVNLKQDIKYVVLGAKNIFENNQFRLTGTDSMLLNSYHFNDMFFFVRSPEKWKNTYEVNYRRREDQVPINNSLRRSAFADEFGGRISLLKWKKVTASLKTTYRKLTIVDSTYTQQAPDNSLVNRLEFGLNLWKGMLRTQTFYEVGSGLESKKAITFLEVNAGQGGWNWIDQNGDGRQGTDEFVEAVFQDTARYIRVFTQTSEFEKVYRTQLSQIINFRPKVMWGMKKGALKFFSRFSDQFAFRIDRKTQRTDILLAFDPLFTQVDDSVLVSLSSSLRNTVSFNQGVSKYGFDYTYQDNRIKSNLVSGSSSRETGSHKVGGRWNIIKPVTLNMQYEDGWENSLALNFPQNNYKIDFFELEPRLVVQPGKKFRVTLLYRYADKQNILDESQHERAIIRESGVEAKYNLLQRGSLQASFSHLGITYSGVDGNTIEFQMLDGLKNGQNYTWALLFQTRIAQNLQLNLQYNGRKSGDNPIIHTGNVQLRAFF
jgi:hypothetical protein